MAPATASKTTTTHPPKTEQVDVLLGFNDSYASTVPERYSRYETEIRAVLAFLPLYIVASHFQTQLQQLKYKENLWIMAADALNLPTVSSVREKFDRETRACHSLQGKIVHAANEFAAFCKAFARADRSSKSKMSGLRRDLELRQDELRAVSTAREDFLQHSAVGNTAYWALVDLESKQSLFKLQANLGTLMSMLASLLAVQAWSFAAEKNWHIRFRISHPSHCHKR